MYNILLGAVSEISNIFTGATFCFTSHGLETAYTEVSWLFVDSNVVLLAELYSFCTKKQLFFLLLFFLVYNFFFFYIKHFLNIVNGVNVYMQHGAVGRASDS